MATIQGVYVALFGRPADPTGLAYFNGVTNNGANLSAIGNLAGQKEYTDRFTGLSNTQIVNSIYQSLFGRDAEASGLTFFANALTTGAQTINTIAINILDGAQGTDKTISANKVAAADLYTKALDTGPEIVAYNGNAAAAQGRTFVSGVSTTVPTTAAVDTAVAAMVSSSNGGGTGTAGVTLTLQVGAALADFISPDQAASASKTTAGNDTIRAVTGGDLASVDSIDGGSGTDTINSQQLLAGSIKPVLKSVELVNLTYGTLTGNVGFDAGDSTGITKLTFDSVKTAVGFDTVTAANIEKTTTVALKAFNSDVASTVTVGFKDVAGGSDAATVSLEKVGGAALTTLGVAGIEKLTLNSTGAAAADVNIVKIVDTSAQSITVTGDKALTLSNDATNTQLKTVDASALNASFTYTATNNGETITGTAKGDSFTLGTGNDTLVYNKVGISTASTSIAAGTVYGDDVVNFNAVNADKINLSALSIGADTTLKAVTTSPVADVAGFFDGTNRLAFNDTTKVLYVDANHDGNFNAATDFAIHLTGVAAADLDKTDFIF